MKLHNWRYKSQNIALDATNIVLALEKIAREELEHRKLAGDTHQIDESADTALIGAKLAIAKLEYAIGTNNAQETANLHKDLMSNLGSMREDLRTETMYTSNLETNKNMIIRNISGLRKDIRKHYLELLASIE